MNKKGFAEIVGGIALVAVIIVGILASQRVINENRYVVYITEDGTGLIYDLSRCSINNLNQNNLKEIRDVNEALKNEGYTLAECSRR